ncbi:alkyl sulfatase dimerization domain-containing protein [Pseudomonas sp. JQ170C]|uniref:alkyl/aryl-sulfatase n=1 Tax=unclassified Pseudomonas TaxID=196821 RepID=UPI00265B6D40|nr:MULTISPECIES: alkyl sulfatase dimerization domain-containing protein [unclassified Pseudomonas]WRO73727.1 alkyl sulfatase dimerization domain-containing protein [Pseudomonas sp. 170C]
MAAALPFLAATAHAEPQAPKPASEITRQANAAVLKALPFNDRQDFEDAQRGLIAQPKELTIRDASGKVVWDMATYQGFIGIDKAAPDTVNPSLWRMAQLNMQYGLFKVTDKIYQVRGYDLSNMTFIEGKTGWIVFDPLLSVETAKAALELVNEHLGKRPIVAVVYSHSHADHFGGTRGIINEQDVKDGKVRLIAPPDFAEHAVSENIVAGNAMSRRAVYMYGALLPRGPQGGVSAGLGQTISSGQISMIHPTETITSTGQALDVDGVKMVFQLTPGSEAPTEMNTYFPQFKALWMAENVTRQMHNIYTLRGAEVRDALQWSHFIEQSRQLYGADAEVEFQSHHWPTWGKERINRFLGKQRDLYKYVHDQTVRLMNEGYNSEEIADAIKLPPELDQEWFNRGYYGTLKHNARAVYQRYMGWYDANPSNLDNLPPVPAARKYVEYMGGEAELLRKARADFDKGEYRWVAEALKHAVFADPDNTAAKHLLADTYEQLGYQAEAGPWRSVYLQGAYELRNGVPQGAGMKTASPDMIRAMSPEMLFDYLAVRLNGPAAAGKDISLNLNFTDLDKHYNLRVQNGVLNYRDTPASDADASMTLSMSTLLDVQMGQGTLEQKIKAGDVKFVGQPQAFADFMGLLDTFTFWFNIVTP